MPIYVGANQVAPGVLFANALSAPATVTLPSGVSAGEMVRVVTAGAAINNVTIVGNIQGITGNAVVTYDDEFTFLFNGTAWQTVGNTILLPETVELRKRMTVKPDSDRIAAINAGISALKANGLWGKIGWLSVMAAHDEQAGRLNWVNPLQSLTSQFTPQWIRDYGFKCDGQQSFFTTNIAINAMPNFSRDSACMGVYIPDNTGASGGLDIGTSASYIVALSGSSMTVRANDNAGGGAVSIAASTAFGWSYWSRQSSTSFSMGRNLVAPTVQNRNSTALDGSIIQIAKVGTTSPSWSSKPMSLVVFGNMTAAEMQTFYSVFIVPYMTALGVPVP